MFNRWMMGALLDKAGKQAAGGNAPAEEPEEQELDQEPEDADLDEEVETAADDDAETPPEPPKRKGRELSIPTSAISTIRREERARGQRAAMALLDRAAKDLGYESHEDLMRSAAENKKKAKPARAAKSEESQASSQELEQARRELEQARARSRRLQQRAQMERKARRRAEQQRLAVEAEREISAAAVQAGVVDVDYAIHLLKREVAGKPRSFLQSFSEKDFFAKRLKKSHPHLFRAQEVPASGDRDVEQGGGGGVGGQGGAQRAQDREERSAPQPGGAKPSVSESPKEDARNMSREEYQKLLDKYQITALSGSMPI